MTENAAKSGNVHYANLVENVEFVDVAAQT